MMTIMMIKMMIKTINISSLFTPTSHVAVTKLFTRKPCGT